MSEPVTVRLSKTISLGSRVVQELTIRPVKAKDLRRVKDSDSSMISTLNMAGWLSGEVSEVIDELEGDDLARVIQVVNDFLFVIQGGTTERSSGS